MTSKEFEIQKLEVIQALADEGYSPEEIEHLFKYLLAIIEPLLDDYFDRPYEKFMKELDDLCL